MKTLLVTHKQDGSMYTKESMKMINHLCPVLSYELFISNCSRLFEPQQYSFIEGEMVWFCAAPLGEKTISTQLNLTKYTNHSIRTSVATLLSRANYNDAEIKSVRTKRLS